MFESAMLRGTFRLVNQALIFGLMVMAALLGSDVGVKRGIFKNLKDSFALEDVIEIKNRPEFVEALLQISQKSKNYFILSSKYFNTEEAGFVQLLGPLQSFSSPKLLGGIDLSINTPQISFTAWVQTEPLFVKGYIMRKRLLPAGYGSELSCWGWHLDRYKGPQFHYGVHDVFPTDTSNTAKARQVEVKLDNAPEFEPSAYTLLTVILSQTSVTFWNNLENLGSVNIRRPVTDCFNNNEGVLLGASGLTVGQLRFYPKALSSSDIEEIYTYGSRLSDMASGSEPADAEESGLDAVSRSVTGEVKQVRAMVQSRQQSVQSDLVLAAVAIEKQNAASYLSPEMAVGDTPSASWDGTTHVSTGDTVLGAGRSYYQIVAGAHHLSATSNSDARYLSNVPDFTGTGATLTFWYRHIPCSVKTCGVYFLHAGDFQDFGGTQNWCWTAWFENEAFWYDGGPNSGYRYFGKQEGGAQMDDKFKVQGDQVWRHMAYQFDETSDKLRLYMDGTMVFESDWGSPVSGVDCAGPGKKWSLGHQYPGYQYGGPVEFADLRMYHHGNHGGPLTADEIFKLSQASTVGLLNANFKCLQITDPALRDQVWQDAYGHNCAWYYSQRRASPEVCHLADARANCPISCQSRQECFTRPPAGGAAKKYFVWDRTRLINMQTLNGTICLGNELDKAKLVEECKTWFAGNKVDLGGTGLSEDRKPIKLPGHLEGFLETMVTDSRVPQPRKTTRINVTICEDLEQSINPYCEFNISQVQEFTKDMKANGGDFTMVRKDFFSWIRACLSVRAGTAPNSSVQRTKLTLCCAHMPGCRHSGSSRWATCLFYKAPGDFSPV
jgi:hypothetical protein